MFNVQIVKGIIEKSNISQKEVLDKAGIVPSTFYSLKNPTAKVLELLADVLHCSIDEFFDRKIESDSHISVGHKVNGNGNRVSGDISLNECKKEIDHLKSLLKEKEKALIDKERTIQILMKKQ